MTFLRKTIMGIVLLYLPEVKMLDESPCLKVNGHIFLTGKRDIFACFSFFFLV